MCYMLTLLLNDRRKPSGSVIDFLNLPHTYIVTRKLRSYRMGIGSYPVVPKNMKSEYRHTLQKSERYDMNTRTHAQTDTHIHSYTQHTWYTHAKDTRKHADIHTQTWREFKMVKSQANTAVFSLTANSPNTHVSPSRGRRISDALTMYLHVKRHRISTPPFPLPYFASEWVFWPFLFLESWLDLLM